jgi:cell migration-inducing and hyaluronan-binding protein
LDERAEVALLSRNIKLFTNFVSLNGTRGPQILGTTGSTLNLEYIEIFGGGHEGVLRRYPIHFHVLRDTRGQVVRGCSIHRSGNRCMTIHSTNNVLIENNICFDIVGHAYFLENAVEYGNKFFGNLGMMIRSGFVLPSDAQPTVFWITNPNNTYIGNVASGSDNTCYWYLANYPLNGDAGTPIYPFLAPWGGFENNVAHTCRVGVRLDERLDPVSGVFLGGSIDPRLTGKPSSERMPIIMKSAVIHHTYDMAVWIRTSLSGDFICRDCVTADNRLSFRLAFHQQLKDSLIVGVSSNSLCSRDNYWSPNGTATSTAQCVLGKPLNLYMGFAIYDGPTEVDQVHFANFYGKSQFPSSYAFMNMGASLKSTVHRSKRISFSNVPLSARVEFYSSVTCSIWSSQLIDEDGSITGVPNSYIIPVISSFRGSLVPELRSLPFQIDSAFNLPPGSNCTKMGSSFTYFCSEKAGLLKIDAPALNSPISAACVNYTRSDGYTVTDCTRDSVFHTSVRLNFSNLYYGFESYIFSPLITLRLFEVAPKDFIIFKISNISESKYVQLCSF